MEKIKSFNQINRIKYGTYSIDVDWKNIKRQLQWYKEDFNLDLDPEYQRGFVWTNQQKIDYIEYILKWWISGRDIFFNKPKFPQELDDNFPLEIVDGKQRLSAVLSFLDNEIPIFGTYFKDYLGCMSTMEAYFKFHINNIEKPLDVVNWYLDMNTWGSAHTREDLKSAYEYRNKNR
jgi:hypothetical protein